MTAHSVNVTLEDTFPSLSEVFAHQAARFPDEEALGVVELVGRDIRAKGYSRQQLWRMVGNAVVLLAKSDVRCGDRVLVSCSHPAEFLTCFLAVQAIGGIPVPVPSLADGPRKSFQHRIVGIAEDSQAKAVLADNDSVKSALASGLAPDIQLVVPDFGDGMALHPCQPPAPRKQEIAFLQYTSGSTGSPKGVIVTHGNVMANIRALAEGAQLTSDDVVYSWLPLFHDMGLIAGLLLGICVGMRTYVARPRTFIVRPESWLRAITRFRATFSLGPNFAYHALAHKASDRKLGDVDLSSWRLALSGGELVDYATVRAFHSRFGKYGLRDGTVRPGYGLAECTLAGSFSRPGTPLRFDEVDRDVLTEVGVAVPARAGSDSPLVVASVGPPVSGHDMSIRDVNTGEQLPERRLGEVVLRGPSVTPGYFGGAKESECRELRTGDLGYIADGELYIVDRLKDLIIIAGRKYPPGDIEAIVGKTNGVRSGATVAFATRGVEGTEDLYVVAGLEPHGRRIASELSASLDRALQEHVGISARRLFLVRPSLLPRTSSGKLQRGACQALLEDGTLEREDTFVRLGRPRTPPDDEVPPGERRNKCVS